MRVLIVEPQKAPYEADIKNSLVEMQKVTGGLIELVELDEKIILVCDEEGKLKELKGNRRVGKDIIAGTFFICGCTYDGEFISLTNKQVEKYQERFKSSEEFTRDDVARSIFINMYIPENDYEPEM